VEPRGLADGARWALVVVFSLAAVEKAQTLLHRSAAWHPVMLAHPRWRRHATALMGASLLGDIGAVAALVLRPAWGGVAAAVLLGSYSLAARGVHGSGGGEDCRCLWKVLRTTTWRGLLARNLGLLWLAGLAATGPEASSLRGVAAGALLLVAVRGLTRRAQRSGGQGGRSIAPGRSRSSGRPSAHLGGRAPWRGAWFGGRLPAPLPGSPRGGGRTPAPAREGNAGRRT
jgi:hypothetical protein